MSARELRPAWLAIFVLALGARVLAWLTEDALHSDEFFQILEPPWWRLTGAGLAAWEWQTGVRSWVLPGYHGAWMALLMSLGVERGPTLALFLQLHWALASLLVVWAAWRGGALVTRQLAPVGTTGSPGWQGGLLAAVLVALFAPIVTAAPHTLSEQPSLICFAVGLVLASELAAEADDLPRARQRQRAFLVGALLALGACLRIANGPLALFGPLVLIVRGRFGLLPWLAAGVLPPVLVFGLVDQLTWGSFASSFVAYVKFNVIEGQSARFGTSPASWYLTTLYQRAPFALPLIVLPALLGLRATWPLALPALGLVALLSAPGHKEERFAMAFWPLILIASAGVVGAWLARVDLRRRLATGVVVAGALVVLVDGARHHTGGQGAKDRFARAWLEGQAVAGDDRAATGLLVERTYYSGASIFFGRCFPQLDFHPAFLSNRVVSHALVTAGSDRDRGAREAGFVPIWEKDGVVLLRRQ